MKYFQFILCLLFMQARLIASYSILDEERCRDLTTVCKDFETSLSCNALQFCLENNLMSMKVNDGDTQIGFIGRLLSQIIGAKSISQPEHVIGQLKHFWNRFLETYGETVDVSKTFQAMDEPLTISDQARLHFNATNGCLEAREALRIFKSFFHQFITRNKKSTTSLNPWKLNNSPFTWHNRKIPGGFLCDVCVNTTTTIVNTVVGTAFALAKACCIVIPVTFGCSEKVTAIQNVIDSFLKLMNFKLFCALVLLCPPLDANPRGHFDSDFSGALLAVQEAIMNPNVTDSICGFWPVSDQYDCSKEVSRLSNSLVKGISTIGKETYECLISPDDFSKMETLDFNRQHLYGMARHIEIK